MRKRLLSGLAAAGAAVALSACSVPGGITAGETDVFPKVSQPSRYTLEIDNGDDKPTKVESRILRKAPRSQHVISADDTVFASYQIQTWDGRVIETTYRKNWTPLPLVLSTYPAPGVFEGLEGHRVGELVQLVIPADKGFGDHVFNGPDGGRVNADKQPLSAVFDIHDAVDLSDDSALAKAKPVDATIPDGISITGDLGKEPTLTVDPSFKAPENLTVILLAEGHGEAIGPDDYAAVHTVLQPLAPLQSEIDKADKVDKRTATSDWDAGQLKLTPDTVKTDRTFLGITVGSRALVIQPSSVTKKDDKKVLVPGAAMIIDYGAKLSSNH